jgi:glutamate-ammonia-ligase adenylyltransferase
VVDIEYLVQLLQIQHAHNHPELRTPNTLAAIAALDACGILAADDHQRLRDAYIFFRRLIDALRMVRGNACDLTTPSAGSEEFEFLARRLGYVGQTSRLKSLLEAQSQNVNDLVRKYLPDQSPRTKESVG